MYSRNSEYSNFCSLRFAQAAACNCCLLYLYDTTGCSGVGSNLVQSSKYWEYEYDILYIFGFDIIYQISYKSIIQTTDYRLQYDTRGGQHDNTIGLCLSPVVCMSCVNLVPGMGKISALKTEEFGIVRMTLKLRKHNQPCFFLFCESKVDVVTLK